MGVNWIDSLIQKDKRNNIGYFGKKKYPFFKKYLYGWVLHPSWTEKRLNKRKFQLQRMVQSRQRKIDVLNSELMLINQEVSLVNKLLKERMKENTNLSNLKSIVILRGKVYTRGKIYYFRKWEWFHLGRTDELKNETDEELKRRVVQQLKMKWSKD